MGNEAGIGICVGGEVEGFSLVVSDGADEVYGIEVGGVGDQVFLVGIGEVHLEGFYDLQRYAVMVTDPIGTAARLAFVFYHATYPQGSV